MSRRGSTRSADVHQAPEQVLRIDDSTICVKDNSAGPQDNSDRILKLGAYLGTPFACVSAFDLERNARAIADGIDSAEIAQRPPEPDNWIFRPHRAKDKKGKEQSADSVWALMLIVDWSNKQGSRQNRSTPVASQATKQRLSDVHNVWWDKKVPGAPSFLDVNYDDAANYPPACGQAAKIKTGLTDVTHLCVNLAKTAGHVTDGAKVAQWWHWFGMTPVGKIGQNSDNENLTTLMARADGYFQGQKEAQEVYGPFSIDESSPPDTTGITVTGHHYWDATGFTNSPLFELNSPALDDSTAIARIPLLKYLRPYVKVPFAQTPGGPECVPPQIETGYGVITLGDGDLRQSDRGACGAAKVTGLMDHPLASGVATPLDGSMLVFNETENEWEARRRNIVTVSTNTLASVQHDTILVDASGGALTITLPPAASASGHILTVKKIDGSINAVTIDPDGAETIDDAATRTLLLQYSSVTIHSDGTEWWVL